MQGTRWVTVTAEVAGDPPRVTRIRGCSTWRYESDARGRRDSNHLYATGQAVSLLIECTASAATVVHVISRRMPAVERDAIERDILERIQGRLEDAKRAARGDVPPLEPAPSAGPAEPAPVSRVDLARAWAATQCRLEASGHAADAEASAAAEMMGGVYTCERARHPHGDTATCAPERSPCQARMGYPAAWDATWGEGVTVGVLDTGCATAHPSLAGATIHVIDCLPSPGPAADSDGHGTHVTSAIVSQLHHGAPFGGAPRCTVVMCRVVDPWSGLGRDEWTARGIRACVMAGCDVICIALASRDPLPWTAGAIAAAHSDGVAVVAAAGNHGDARTGADYPARYTGAVGVGASSPAGELAAYSPAGSSVDVLAAGTQQWGAVGSDGYARWTGTSMATAHVSAGVALVLSAARRVGRTSMTGVDAAALLVHHARGRDPDYWRDGASPGEIDVAAAIGGIIVPGVVAGGDDPVASPAAGGDGDSVADIRDELRALLTRIDRIVLRPQ